MQNSDQDSSTKSAFNQSATIDEMTKIAIEVEHKGSAAQLLQLQALRDKQERVRELKKEKLEKEKDKLIQVLAQKKLEEAAKKIHDSIKRDSLLRVKRRLNNPQAKRN